MAGSRRHSTRLHSTVRLRLRLAGPYAGAARRTRWRPQKRRSVMDDAGNVTAPTKLIDTGAVEARNTGRTSRILVALAACSLILLFAGMERSMANPSLTRQVLQVEHIKIETTKKFADAVAALEKN